MQSLTTIRGLQVKDTVYNLYIGEFPPKNKQNGKLPHSFRTIRSGNASAAL